MSRPHYSNSFSITQNENKTETVVHFIHEYPQTENVVNAFGEEEMKMKKVRDCVTTVMVNKEGLVGLRNLLDKVINEMNNNPQ